MDGVGREFRFFFKVALACTLCKLGLDVLLRSIEHRPTFVGDLVLYWLTTSATFYAVCALFEHVVKPAVGAQFSVRVESVPPQPYPPPSVRGVLRGELKALATGALILLGATRHAPRAVEFESPLMEVIYIHVQQSADA